MPRIRFVKGVIWKGEGVGPGFEAEVSDKEAQILCDGYKDAVRIDGGEAPKRTGMTVEDVIHRDPVAEHRDPATRPSGRRK